MADVTPIDEPVQDHLLSNQSYDVLQQLVRVVLPALAALYVALAGLWDFPKVEEVVGTLTALTAFLGVFLNLSKRSYSNSTAKYDGIINVETDPETGLHKADMILKNYENPADIIHQSEATFKIFPPGVTPPGLQ